MSLGDVAVPLDVAGDEWQALLDAYEVRFVVLDVQRDRGWQQAMCREPGWAIDTENEETILYARVSEERLNHVEPIA